jgi:hypothetical protein
MRGGARTPRVGFNRISPGVSRRLGLAGRLAPPVDSCATLDAATPCHPRPTPTPTPTPQVLNLVRRVEVSLICWGSLPVSIIHPRALSPGLATRPDYVISSDLTFPTRKIPPPSPWRSRVPGHSQPSGSGQRKFAEHSHLMVVQLPRTTLHLDN